MPTEQRHFASVNLWQWSGTIFLTPHMNIFYHMFNSKQRRKRRMLFICHYKNNALKNDADTDVLASKSDVIHKMYKVEIKKRTITFAFLYRNSQKLFCIYIHFVGGIAKVEYFLFELLMALEWFLQRACFFLFFFLFCF